MDRKTWFLIFFGLIFYVNIVSAQNQTDSPHVFQVRTGECSQKPQAQTGFRIVGIKGIITALHGVAGCKTINAINENEDLLDLSIIRADIDRDVALLGSSKININKSNLGLKKSIYPEYGGLHVFGYPLGLEEQIVSEALKIRRKSRRKLNTLLPFETINLLKKSPKQSPKLDIEVLSIEGHLLHGYSGAPIINNKNEVVGVANGGLEDGFSEIVWAIPWHDIKWKKTLQRDLKNLSGTNLFSFFSSSPSKEILSLEIILKESTWMHRAQKYVIYQDIFTERAGSYHLSSPWGINLDKVKRILIKKKNQVLFAEGSPNKELLSTDGNYGFMLSKNGGFLVLAVNPNPSVPQISVIKNNRLMWLDGDIRELTWNDAKLYVFQANQKGLGGYRDWQLPTTAQLKKLARFVRGKSNSFVSDYEGWFWSRNEKPSPHNNPIYNFAYVANISSDERFQKGPEKIENSHYVILVRRVARND